MDAEMGGALVCIYVQVSMDAEMGGTLVWVDCARRAGLSRSPVSLQASLPPLFLLSLHLPVCVRACVRARVCLVYLCVRVCVCVCVFARACLRVTARIKGQVGRGGGGGRGRGQERYKGSHYLTSCQMGRVVIAPCVRGCEMEGREEGVLACACVCTHHTRATHAPTRGPGRAGPTS